jgi:hypothetical protein
MRGDQRHSEPVMEAIVAIVIFVGAILALNRYEFGRFD